MFLVLGISILLGGCSRAGLDAEPVAAPAGAHHDHSSQRGGTVLMNGDVHFEIVPDFGGTHVVLFSDAYRRAMPASEIQEATLTVMRDGEAPEVLALRAESDGTWTARGRRIDAPEVTLRFSYLQRGGEPYTIDLPVTAHQPEHAGHQH
jgi:hypothetical protein